MTLLRPISFSLICIVILLSFSIVGEEVCAGKIEKTGLISREINPEVKDISDALSHFIMGTIYDNNSRPEEALMEYDRAIKYQPGITTVYLKKGADLLLTGNPDDALDVLEKAVELDEKEIKAYLLMALIYTSKGQFDLAQKKHEKALEYDPENIKVLTFLSDLFIIQQKLDEAAGIYEKIIEIKQNDPLVLFNLGIIYSKLNDYEKAVERLNAAVELDENYIEAHMVLGFLYEITGSNDKAISEYKKVLEIDSLNRDARSRLGQLYQKLGETEEAIDQNLKLMRIDITDTQPYLRNFSIYIQEKNYKKAEESLKKALSNGVDDPVIYASLGYLSSILDRQEESVEYYTIAREKDPEEQMYLFFLSVSLEKTGKRKKAIRLLEKAVKKENVLPEILNYLGYLYVEEDKKLDDAVALIKRALEIKPGNGAYLDSLGWAYFKKGDYLKAAKNIERARDLIPMDPTIREHLGEVYWAQGEEEKALKQWQISYQIDPTNKALKEKITNLKNKIKNLNQKEKE